MSASAFRRRGLLAALLLASGAIAFQGCSSSTLQGGDAGGGTDAGNPFARCDRPPPSVCTREETCQELGCGGLEFDEKGCHRAACQADAECSADERCTSVQCISTGSCQYDQGHHCGCSGPAICGMGAFCNPVAVVGPAGDWKSLEVHHGSGPCPPGSICTSSWKITSDGGLAASKSGQPVTSQLSDLDLGELRRLVMGPELRLALRDGIPCDPPPTDIGITLILELSTVTLQRDVTGCVITGPQGNVFQQVDMIATRY